MKLTDLPAEVRARMTAPSPRKFGRHSVTVFVPVGTKSEPNQRGHWAKRYGRSRRQREATTLAIAGLPLPALPVVVTLQRLGPRRYDDDNAVASLKAYRDQVAAEYGVSDADPRILFAYGCQIRTKELPCVRIHIVPVPPRGGVRAAGGQRQ
jgi:hypothetical protein